MMRIVGILRNWAKLLLDEYLSQIGLILVRYDSERRRSRTAEVARIKKERPLLLKYSEACQLISALTATDKIPGDIAEVGVAYGASAKLLCTFAPERILHLFDTFEGLPEPTTKDSPQYKAGQYSCDLESVKQYLAHTRTEFHKGLFPHTAEAVKDKAFAFVHLDVDLYESTLAGLQFFYPRLSSGGILISHDYLLAAGVGRAFTEFFADKPETVVELIGDQCMIVKLGEPNRQNIMI